MFLVKVHWCPFLYFNLMQCKSGQTIMGNDLKISKTKKLAPKQNMFCKINRNCVLFFSGLFIYRNFLSEKLQDGSVITENVIFCQPLSNIGSRLFKHSRQTVVSPVSKRQSIHVSSGHSRQIMKFHVSNRHSRHSRQTASSHVKTLQTNDEFDMIFISVQTKTAQVNCFLF